MVKLFNRWLEKDMRLRRECRQCGRSLDGKRIDAVYCSQKCRTAAWIEPSTLYVGITKQGNLFVWPIILPLLAGVVFQSAGQVARLEVTKSYGDKALTAITIAPL